MLIQNIILALIFSFSESFETEKCDSDKVEKALIRYDDCIRKLYVNEDDWSCEQVNQVKDCSREKQKKGEYIFYQIKYNDTFSITERSPAFEESLITLVKCFDESQIKHIRKRRWSSFLYSEGRYGIIRPLIINGYNISSALSRSYADSEGCFVDEEQKYSESEFFVSIGNSFQSEILLYQIVGLYN